MLLPRVFTNRASGGLGRRSPADDNISGMIIAVPAGYAGGIVNDYFTFLSTADAINAGITELEDLGSKVPAYHHIAEFFRLSPSGTLHVKFVLQGTTMAAMLLLAGAHAIPLLNYAAGKIRQLGVVLNRDVATYAPVITNGLDYDTTDAVTKAAQLTTNAEAAGMPLVVLVEGRGFSGVPSTVLDATTLNSRNTGIVLLQDAAFRASDSGFAGYAAVGSVLGLMSAAAVHENIGWVAKFNLQGDGIYAEAGFSSNQLESQLTGAGLNMLLAKGYIFGRTFPNHAGVFIADDAATMPVDDDYARLRYGRTSQKAVRGVRKALLPWVNAPMYLDDSGKLDNGSVKALEQVAAAPLDTMEKTLKEISGYDVYIDPDQDILGTDTVNIKIAILPVGCASYINVTIALTTKLD